MKPWQSTLFQKLRTMTWRAPKLVHELLFALSLMTTFAAGIYMAGADPFSPEAWNGSTMLLAAAYALGLMAILFAHEMGHYLQARRHGVDVSRPYFLPGLGPIPGLGVIPFFGTFGAFIKLRLGRMPAHHLLKIGAWGPLAGFIVMVPVLMVGMFLSEVRPLPEEGEFLMLGDSLLLWAGAALFHPDIPEGHDVFLHPLAMAGWVGCLLTALNLLPIGQLDGGHIAYSVWGSRYRPVARILFYGLVLLGIFAFPGWLVFAALIGFMGPTHPEMMEGEPVRGPDLWLAWVSLGMFVLTFTPRPVVVESLPTMLGLW
jgi:membrane-associated protease RseP (regulator of RpoE activity)